MLNKEEKLAAFARVLDVLETLREKCPWDRKQTNQSLRPNTLEEAYELADALQRDDRDEIIKELGDLLLHICFYAKIGEEQAQFDLTEVCNRLCDKLIFRHPHVYPPEGTEAQTLTNADQVSQRWEQMKQKENNGNVTVLGGVPASLPTLIKAYRIQDKARNVGFDWEETRQVWDKVKEEIHEFETELNHMDTDKAEAEFGDLLFSLINVARFYDINPDNALERTNQKFIRRFNYLESRTLKQGIDLNQLTLQQMDELWEEAKALERNTPR